MTTTYTDLANCSISELFDAAVAYYEKIMEGPVDEELFAKALHSVQTCMKVVEAADLYSINEGLQEISTKTLKLLGLDYYLGKVYTRQTNLLLRLDHLQEAQRCFKKYIKLCRTLRLLEQEDMRYDSDDDEDEEGIRQSKRILTPEEQRNQKIAKYKREKEAKERMQSLQRLVQRSGMDGDNDDMEEETRQLVMLQLQSYARDTQDEQGMLEQEMVLLQHMNALRTCADSSEASSSSTGTSNSRYPSVPGLPDRSVSDTMGGPAASQGLTITKASKIGDQVVLSRETLVSSVFRDSIAPPTMTLEEYGDIQLAEAQERAAREQQAESGTKRYAQLVADGQEENLELVDQATIKDREWDAWKEENPRGSGNRMGKRF